MAYIGNPPAERYSAVSYQDLTGGSGTSFTLDYAVGSANEIEIFVNNVRQEPNVAYTCAGTALTMTGAISATDDFYVVFQSKAQQTATHPAGNNLQAVDGTFTGNVNVATIKDSSATNTGLTIDSNGIVELPNTTMLDVFRLHTDHTSTGVITSWERPDDGIQSGAKIGLTMTEASGVFTFPRTGLYKISFFATMTNASGDDTTAFELYGTSDNSTYARLTRLQEGNTSSTNTIGSVFGFTVVDITDTSTHKVRFYADSVGSGSKIQGNQDRNHTAVMFEFMGNT